MHSGTHVNSASCCSRQTQQKNEQGGSCGHLPPQAQSAPHPPQIPCRQRQLRARYSTGQWLPAAAAVRAAEPAIAVACCCASQPPQLLPAAAAVALASAAAIAAQSSAPVAALHSGRCSSSRARCCSAMCPWHAGGRWRVGRQWLLPALLWAAKQPPERRGTAPRCPPAARCCRSTR